MATMACSWLIWHVHGYHGMFVGSCLSLGAKELVIHPAWDAAAQNIPNTHKPHLLTPTLNNPLRFPGTRWSENEQHHSAPPKSTTPMSPAGAMLDIQPTQDDRMQGWQNYPTAHPRSLRSAEDVDDLQEQLERKSEDLFISDLSKRKLEVWIEGADISDEIARANII